jgi:hypothetical protein
MISNVFSAGDMKICSLIVSRILEDRSREQDTTGVACPCVGMDEFKEPVP